MNTCFAVQKIVNKNIIDIIVKKPSKTYFMYERSVG